MIKKITKPILLFSIIGISNVSFADFLKIKDSAPESYVVKKGDTLWDISEKYLHSPWKWPKLWDMNDYINNPHLIYPGDKIKIIINNNGEKEILINNKKTPLKRTVLSPDREAKKQKIYINSINFNEIETLVSGVVINNKEELGKYGKVLGNNNTESFYSKYDTIYINNKTELESGDKINFYKKPEVLNYNTSLLKYSGNGVVLNKHKNNIYSVFIESSVDLITPESLTKYENKTYNYGFNFKSSENVLFEETKILYSFDQKSFLGKGNVFIIEKGESDNVSIGQVFNIEKKGKKTPNGKIPNEIIGQSVVFNVNKNHSFLQIVFSKKPIDAKKSIIKKIKE